MAALSMGRRRRSMRASSSPSPGSPSTSPVVDRIPMASEEAVARLARSRGRTRPPSAGTGRRAWPCPAGAARRADHVGVALVPRRVGDLDHQRLHRRSGPVGSRGSGGDGVEQPAPGADVGEHGHRPGRPHPRGPGHGQPGGLGQVPGLGTEVVVPAEAHGRRTGAGRAGDPRGAAEGPQRVTPRDRLGLVEEAPGGG